MMLNNWFGVAMHTHTHKQPEQKTKATFFFSNGVGTAKVRFYNASVYAQQQEVSTNKQTQQNRNHHNAEFIYALE